LKTEFDQKWVKLSQKNTNKISADSLFNVEYFGTTFKSFWKQRIRHIGLYGFICITSGFRFL
jgi:hypothetical protein